MKTYKGWLDSKAETIDEYLIINDEVDEEMIDYFRDILPPVTCNCRMLQVGEPSDHIDRRAIYVTFEKKQGKWIFKGNCFKGGDVIKKRECINAINQ